MPKRLIKLQAVLFGNFNFPVVPETSVRLLTTFASHGFMPQVMNVPDPMAGVTIQRIGLTKGTDIQVLFAPERIDFTVTMPSSSIEDFVNDVVSFIEKLEGGTLQFSRIALVSDSLIEEISQADSEALREKLLPSSGNNSIEWVARWVTPITVGSEQYNACFEAMNANGLMMIINGNMKPLSGIKVMHDISTTPLNTTLRFDAKNLNKELNAISDIIISQAGLTEI